MRVMGHDDCQIEEGVIWKELGLPVHYEIGDRGEEITSAGAAAATSAEDGDPSGGIGSRLDRRIDIKDLERPSARQSRGH